MDRIEKFLRRASPKLRDRLERILFALQLNQWEGLDIAPLKGNPGLFRCRVGNIRIIVLKSFPRSVAIDMDYRGNVYKK